MEIASVLIEPKGVFMSKMDRKRLFEVEGYKYIVEFDESNEFKFYLDADASRLVIPLTKDEIKWGDAPVTEVWGRWPAKNVFKVAAEVKLFVEQSLKYFKPAFFSFAANQEAKGAVYGRFARKLARESGFELFEEKNRFLFVGVAARAA